MTPRDPEKLERLIHQTLRSVPDRRAPFSLEGRVLAAIAAQAALPWWRKSFLQWPLAAQVAFLVVIAGVVKLVMLGLVWATGDFEFVQFRNAFATQFSWIELIGSAVAGVADFCAVVFRAIPPLWLYGGLAVLASLYATLFGLGAAAYRVLYAQR